MRRHNSKLSGSGVSGFEGLTNYAHLIWRKTYLKELGDSFKPDISNYDDIPKIDQHLREWVERLLLHPEPPSHEEWPEIVEPIRSMIVDEAERLKKTWLSKEKVQPEIVTFHIGPVVIMYPSAPGPWPRMYWPARNWDQPPIAFQEPWWAPHCPEDEPKAEPAPHMDKRWRGLWVDSPIKDDWLERMNSIPNMWIAYTCAGHGIGDTTVGHTNLYPLISFHLDVENPLTMTLPSKKELEAFWTAHERIREYLQGRFADIAHVMREEDSPKGAPGFSLSSWLPRIWMTECQFDAWWEDILGRLEMLAADGWAE
jgi:hypothetical protein